MRLRWTLGRALLACLVITGALIAALTAATLSAWKRSIAATATGLQASAAARATTLVDEFLGHLRRVLADVERRRAAGVCDLGDAARARACLVGSVAPDDVLAEATFTSAAGWQASAWRDADGTLCTTTIAPSGSAFVATRRCGTRTTTSAATDPRTNPTYQTPASIEDDRVIWSDLSYAALDDDLPEPERRVVVHALRAIRDGDGDGGLVGVLRVALLEKQLDDAFARVRVNERDPNDPFRVFLADDEGRLITRFRPGDRLRVVGDDLRIAPADVPPAVAAALADGHAAGHVVTFTELPPDTQDWRVGVIGPDDYYARAPRRARRIMTAAALAVLALVALLFAWVVRAVHRGLDRVVGETERMRRFELQPSAATTAFADIDTVLAGLERAKTAMRALGKYAPIDLVRRLFADNVEPTLGGELRRVTLLFTDIKDFTTFAEALPPERLATLLGRYFEVMTAAVTQQGGTVDKYIGDALMVLWNAPVAVADHAARACRAALACVAAAHALCASEEWRGLPPLTTRFGIHTGDVMVGHFGAPARFSYTALGDGVNLAARLEGLNKQYGTTILVSAAVEAAVRGEFDFAAVGRVTVKGKTQAVDVFELRGAK
jgi:adenylate cyclase